MGAGPLFLLGTQLQRRCHAQLHRGPRSIGVRSAVSTRGMSESGGPVFGDVVRAYRRRLGMTQEELADKTGLSVRGIGRIEAGRIALPRARTLRLLADAFGLAGGERDRFCHVVESKASSALARLGPAQLPTYLEAFVGRTEQLSRLDAMLPVSSRHDSASMVIAIDGPPGVGKTTLAVRWAHRVADRYPDGQLYVNLRGFDGGGPPVEAAWALRGFLHALDVAPQRIPADLDAQAALFRSLLAGRRMLIVVDNARDSAAVRPLLPGAPGCLVLVTSRNQLTGLIAADGAHPLKVDLFTDAEAAQLLAHRIGNDRVAAEPAAAEEIIRHCAGLPLALAIVAARALVHPQLRIEPLAHELRDAATRLDALSTGDPATDVRAVLSWSYAALAADAASLFRLLGLHPGPDISMPAMASLAGLDPARVRRLVDEMVRAHLMVEHSPGRYAMHDLLRAYAVEQARLGDAVESQIAERRMLDHYVHTGYAAARQLNPHLDQITLTLPAQDTAPEHIATYDAALAWFTAEHAVLLALVHHAVATGQDLHTWQLARTLGTFLDRRGLWHDRLTVELAAVGAANRLGDATGQARAQRNLASTYIELGRYDDAYAHLTNALNLAARTGDVTRLAHTQGSLGYLRERQGRHSDALQHARQALRLYQEAGHRVGQARALNQIGWYHGLLAHHDEALTYCRLAIGLFQALDDREGEAAAWDSLGYAHHQLAHHTDAFTSYQRALSLFRRLGDRYYEAGTLTRLAESHYAVGDLAGARAAWHDALAILTELDHADAEQVRARLRDLNDAEGTSAE